MIGSTSTCVAVGVPDLQEALDYYTGVFGFAQGASGEDWVEVKSGALTLFLTPDDGRSPCFEFLTHDIPMALKKIVDSGGTHYADTDGEAYVQDKYGLCFCLSNRVC